MSQTSRASRGGRERGSIWAWAQRESVIGQRGVTPEGSHRGEGTAEVEAGGALGYFIEDCWAMGGIVHRVVGKVAGLWIVMWWRMGIGVQLRCN